MVIWAPRAIADIRDAWDYIALDNEVAASRVAMAIELAGESLSHFPRRGRRGKVPDTRELQVPKTPYFIVYCVDRSGAVEIARVIHGRQDWPPKG